jgi:pSer/pThr/pTyr-binding forkhead associated (FHA) protein
LKSTALLEARPNELILTVLSGGDKGVVYKLLGDKISLGRSPDSDVIINDAKASRFHARIERRVNGVYLLDLDSKTGVTLNGNAVIESALKEGDMIRIGDTSLSFGNATSALTTIGAPPIPPLSQMAPPPLPGLKASPQNYKPINPFIVIIAIGLIIATFLMTQTKVFKLRKTKIKDQSAFDQQIQGSDEFNQSQEKVILEKGKDTQQYAEAQAFYLRGFREYRETNYGRAIQDFEASLALYPAHPLAKRYLERSRLKNNEAVSSAMERGERDFQLQRYMNAFNEYRTVILLSSDAQNKNFQLAQRRIEAIQLILTNNR